MIPLRLNLTNFMCYRGTTSVDFSGIHLAVLAGDNGQGKSALLDAMTWVLWGKARTNADQLVTYGERDMTVQLDFSVSGQDYTVTRGRDTSGRGSSSLELVLRRANGSASSLTGNGIRETETRIREILRLDYDTFVNSAFLRQGQADEFTTKPPAKRKQILADILGLAEYDDYAEVARRRVRDLEAERERLEIDLERIRGEVERIPQLEEDVRQAEALAEATHAEVREATTRLQALQDERRELDAKAEQLARKEQGVKETRNQIAALTGKLAVQQDKLAAFDALLARRDELDALREQWEEARAAHERWNELKLQSVELQAQSIDLQREIDRARAELESELKAAEASAEVHRGQLKRFSKMGAALGEARAQLERLDLVRAKQEEAQRACMQWGEQLARLKVENDRLRATMKDLKERMDLLQGTESTECPVCRQPLSEEHQLQALQEAQAEGKTMGDLYRANQKAMTEAQAAREQAEEALKRHNLELKEGERWRTAMARATQAAEEEREAAQALEEAETRAAQVRTRLHADDYAPEAQQQLSALASQSEQLGYDRAAHDEVRAQIQALGTHQKDWEELHNAVRQRPTVADLVDTYQQQITQLEAQIASEEAEIDTLRVALREREETSRRAREQQILVNQLQGAHSQAQRQAGSASQKLKFARDHAAKQSEVEKAHHQAVEERTLYAQLANAFGKRGVQAMIIESAIPEIEQAANDLLGRMTNGRMNVALVTQREAKSVDGMIETLDILISDEQGERAYETFSGGEAFRINFALRIALSKLLAHRSGTSLRTLVIDEGFGSQDAQGRDRLVEAITSVQDDFERILVITHIDELKDAFPTRIDITKLADGTQVVVA